MITTFRRWLAGLIYDIYAEVNPRIYAKEDEQYGAGFSVSFKHNVSDLSGRPISFAAAERILDAFIDAVTKEGLSCGGGVSPEPPVPAEAEDCDACNWGECSKCHGRCYTLPPIVVEVTPL